MLAKLQHAFNSFKTPPPVAVVSPPKADVGRVIVPDQRNSYFFPWNPDDIWRKRNNYDIYDEMMVDYQIKSLIDIKKNLIMGAGFEIENPRDDEGKEIESLSEITSFVHFNLVEKYNGSFQSDLYRCLDSMIYGFSLNEILYDLADSKIILKKIKAIPPNGIKFMIDEFGNLLRNGITQRTKTGEVSLPIEKFIYYKWNDQFSNPYGKSDLRCIYDAWFIKKELRKYWAMYLERFGMPFAVIKYPPDLKSQATDMQKLVKQIQASSSAVIPEDLKLELIETSQSGGDAFERAIGKLDKQIAVGLQIPDLLGFSASESTRGSFALGREQSKIFMTIIDRYRTELEYIVNTQIIKRLVDLNFNNVSAYPKFCIKEIFKDDNLDKIKTFIELQKTNTFEMQEELLQHAIEELGFPPSKIIIKKGSTLEANPVDPKKEKENPIKDAKTGDEKDDKIKEDAKQAALATNQPSRTFKTIDMTTKIGVEDIVNFAAIDKMFDDEIAESTEKISKILISTRDNLIYEIQVKKPLEKDAFGYIEAIKISPEDTGKIRTVLDRTFYRMSLQGINEANTEVKKQTPNNFDLLNDPLVNLTSAKEFLKKFAKSKSFLIAGGLSDSLKKDIQNTLIEGVREGKTTKQMTTDMMLAFEPYVAGNIIPTSAVNPYRMEAIVRTNITNFYNQGRMGMFKSSRESGLIPFMQFSAILDARTTEICTELHGTVLPADDPSLGSITPSRHFNCRSLLIPITKYRVADMQESLQNGTLKEGLTKPVEFYDGFQTKTKPVKPE